MIQCVGCVRLQARCSCLRAPSKITQRNKGARRGGWAVQLPCPCFLPRCHRSALALRHPLEDDVWSHSQQQTTQLSCDVPQKSQTLLSLSPASTRLTPRCVTGECLRLRPGSLKKRPLASCWGLMPMLTLCSRLSRATTQLWKIHTPLPLRPPPPRPQEIQKLFV